MKYLEKTPLAWLNTEMVLFDFTDPDDFIWLRDVGVERITQIDVSGTHSGNAPDRVTLYGYLPKHGPYLESLDNGHTFHITWRECGPPDRYRDQDVVIALSDCAVLQRWVDKPVIISPNDASAVCMCVLLKCKVEVRYGREAD